MTINLKYVLYAVLAAISLWCGVKFYSLYSKDRPSKEAKQTQSPPANEIPAPIPSTNEVADTNNPASSNVEGIDTNSATAVATLPTASPTDPSQGTNDLSSANATTNPSASSNLVETIEPSTSATNTVSREKDPDSGEEKIGRGGKNSGGMIAYFAGFLISLITLGVLLGHEVSQVFGQKAVDFLFNDEGEGQKNPEYDEAEQVWASGQPLEAIQLMRDYLKRNPTELYVAIRIAEIYEKDLKNNLAAALEYEEILTYKLPPERWGWAAIHLCNVYSKMGQNDKTIALLQRIVDEHPKTGAAKKALKRQAMLKGKSPAEAAAFADATLAELEADEAAAEAEALKPPPSKVKKGPPPSNLPPGFRPK